MRTTWSFYTAGQLTFGYQAVQAVGAEARRRGFRRVLIVTDPVLDQLGVVARVTEPLREAGLEYGVCQDGEAEPTLAAADKAISAARDFQPDAILGLGGGSNMDLAKVTAVAYAHGGTPHDYFNFDNVPGPVTPLICVPTTAGTGSEVSHAAVLTDSANQMKVSTLSQYLRPAVAIVDPELTLSCPPQVTADSGIDALTHAVEAYTAADFSELPFPPGQPCAYEGRHPLGDCLAEKAIALIGRHLVDAVKDGTNREARAGMALAATLAGMAFSNCGVALVHAMEYPLGGALHCSHGAGNGLLLPFVMRFNLPRRVQAFGRIAQLLGRDTRQLDQQQAAEEAVRAVEQLKRDIGIPERIRDIGGAAEQLPVFAEKAFGIKRLMQVNPREPTLNDLLGIFRDAL